MRQVTQGSTNISVDVYIVDDTDGTPETGVLWNTSGMDLEYRRELAAAVNVTEVTLAALTTAHADGGFLEIGHGYYRFDVPDAAFASGAASVSVQGTVTGMVVLPQTIQLVAFDTQDSTRLGLTALPNAAADAAGGLPISDAGGLDLDGMNTNVNDIETDTADLQANQGNWVTATGFATTAEIADVPTVAEFNARTLASAAYFDPAVDAVANVTLVATTTTNTDMVAAAPTAAAIRTEIDANSAQIGAGAILDLSQIVITNTGAGDNIVLAGSGAGDGISFTRAGAGNAFDTVFMAQFNSEMDTAISDATLATATNLATMQVDVSAILADTNELQLNQGNWLTVTGHATEAKQDIIDTNVDAILVDTNELQTDDVPALIAALPTAAEINAEMVDVLETDTHAEPNGVVGATASLKDSINYVKTMSRNKMTQTATTTLLRNDGDTGTISTSTVSDDGTTFTKGKHT